MKKILLGAVCVFAIGMVAACTNCGVELEEVVDHYVETTQEVETAYGAGTITKLQATSYEEELSESYALISEGSDLCEEDEEAAIDKFDEVEEALDTIDAALALSETSSE